MKLEILFKCSVVDEEGKVDVFDIEIVLVLFGDFDVGGLEDVFVKYDGVFSSLVE